MSKHIPTAVTRQMMRSRQSSVIRLHRIHKIDTWYFTSHNTDEANPFVEVFIKIYFLSNQRKYSVVKRKAIPSQSLVFDVFIFK